MPNSRLFDLTPRKRYPPRPKPPKGKKPVTIAIGFKSSDAIVLSTDRQITDYGSSLKYYEQKIYPLVGQGWCAVCAYAGYRNIMKAVQTEFARRVNFEPRPTFAFLESCLTGVLQGVKKIDRKSMQDQQMFCALSGSEGERLLRYQSDLLAEVPDGDCEFLGVGDSALIRYLTDITGIRRTTVTPGQALLLAFYMVAKANKYIDGCGEGPDVALVTRGIVKMSSRNQRDTHKPPDLTEEDLTDAILALTNCFDFNGRKLQVSFQNILDQSANLRDSMRNIVGKLLPTTEEIESQQG